jgi:hypothetical protein
MEVKSWDTQVYLWCLNWFFIYILFFSVARIATSNLERLQRVQNRALRCIYRLDWSSSVDMIHDLNNLPLVRDRLIENRINIGKRYLAKAVINNPYVCLLLSEYLESKASIRRGEVDTPLCLFYWTMYSEILGCNAT